MARRKKHEEHENHERWLVSYADFITLLFAFFVVMYAVSSVNEGKYRVLANSLMTAFRNPMRSLEPIQVGELVRSPNIAHANVPTATSPVALPKMDFLPSIAEETGEGGGEGEGGGGGEAERLPVDVALADEPPFEQEAMDDLLEIARDIERALAPLIDMELIEVRRQKWWLEVEIKTSILFASGSASLERNALPVLRRLARIFRTFPNPIEVEGFTDDVPISTVAFPSNWELSAARAASVVRVLAQDGISPRRMLAIGYGEHRPVADNATPDGRAKNRRVVIVIPASDKTRRLVDPLRFQARESAPRHDGESRTRFQGNEPTARLEGGSPAAM